MTDIVYDSAKRPQPFWEELVGAYRYRDLVVQLVSRDVKTRYKRSVIGVAWTMLNPLLIMTALSVVFSHVFRFDLPRYPLYLLTGLILWNFFAQTTMATSHLIRAGGPLITRVYVPRTIFAIAATGTGLVNLLLALLPLFIIGVFLGVPPTPALLWLPIPILIAVAFSLGIGLLVASLAVPFPDVVEMYEVILTAWYFLTPIFYPVAMVSAEFREALLFNPMYHIVAAFRAPLYEAAAPDPVHLIAGGAAAATSLIVGWYVFSTRADDIAGRL
jgi:ABC-type polysaccharide/polyol phosphate export permease